MVLVLLFLLLVWPEQLGFRPAVVRLLRGGHVRCYLGVFRVRNVDVMILQGVGFLLAIEEGHWFKASSGDSWPMALYRARVSHEKSISGSANNDCFFVGESGQDNHGGGGAVAANSCSVTPQRLEPQQQ